MGKHKFEEVRRACYISDSIIEMLVSSTLPTRNTHILKSINNSCSSTSQGSACNTHLFLFCLVNYSIC